ncbi:9508_t:CDS:1 [Dentiscutata heterogama]|uniref:9508_t:CDS:1 n=1 Tax=Dentiscutata heterogama TaxID=1316150 RepID=A0ACA9NC13_9GLOM|nr:9508_t:CDS:1 [Dentiscutata heterogama]
MDLKNKPEHEIPIPDTPKGYQLLYQRAWSFHPQERPSIEYINEELDEMLKNSKSSFFSDLFGKKPKNHVSSFVNSSTQINSDNFSTQIHSDNANIIHHRVVSESTNPSVSKIIPEINDRNSGPPLPKKPSYIGINQETVIPPNIPKKPPDNLMNSDSNVDQLNSIQHQHYRRYELEEQQNLAFSKDPIQDQNKSTPFQQNSIHHKTQYNSDPISQSPHPQYGYYQPPPHLAIYS